jgi:hypothetical protein
LFDRVSERMLTRSLAASSAAASAIAGSAMQPLLERMLETLPCWTCCLRGAVPRVVLSLGPDCIINKCRRRISGLPLVTHREPRDPTSTSDPLYLDV